MDFMSLLHNPATLVFMIPIAAILVGGLISITKMIINHRERMAMIERGIDPDTKKPPRDLNEE